MKWRIVMSTFLIAAFLAVNAWADPEGLFIKKCGACHKKGGTASVINPGDKAAQVWENFFQRRRHRMTPMNIDDADLQIILKYLKDHAADSSSPAMATIPE